MSTDFFLDLFCTLPQNGPGSSESSLRALNSIKDLDSIKTILDVGCGSGRQTIFLGQNTKAQIIAVDNLEYQVNLLKKNIDDHGLSERIQAVQGSMIDLSFLTQKQDLIWSEGSIYNVGFEKGLTYFKDHLSDRGYIGASDVVWLTDKRPKEIDEFWNESYPGITDIESNLKRVNKCGYTLIDHFTLPESDWRVGYYDELSQRVEDHYAKGVDNTITSPLLELNQGEVLAMAKQEIEMFNKYHQYYSYEFFVMKK